MLKETTKKLKTGDFLKNHIITNLKVDINNTYALYFDQTLDLKSNLYHKNVNIVELDGFEINRLDLPFEPDDFFINNKEIILKITKKEKTIFYLYDHSCRKLHELNSIPFEVKLFACDETKIYFTSVIKRNSQIDNIICSQAEPVSLEGREINGTGVTGLFRSDYNGKEITLISSLDMDLDQVDFDFINNHIVFSAFEKKTLKPISSAVYVYDIKKETMKLLFGKNFRISNVQSMSKKLILFTGVDLDQNSRNDNQQIYQIDVDTAIVLTLGDFQDKSNENPSVVTDSFFSISGQTQKFKDVFYFKLVESDRDMLYKINMKGNIKAIETGMKTLGSFFVTEKGIILVGLKSLKLSELYFFSEGETRQISHHNRWLDDYSLSKAEIFTCKIDKVDINGYIFPPLKIWKSKKHPAILMIHGGPKMIYSDIIAHDIQLLCANGYYVFCANPMGSDGRGNDFLNIRGQFGSLPYKQLMFFTDKVLENYPNIDADRLGVSGGSYGGYMTNYIITRTSRFRAAVSERGISNIMTSFTSSDIGYQFMFEYMGNFTPWTNPSAAMEASPVYQAHKTRTPTLFIHGKDDQRCHYTESLNMFSALNYHGVETRICLFEKESHSLVVQGRPQSKMQRYKELLSWFDKFLKRSLS